MIMSRKYLSRYEIRTPDRILIEALDRMGRFARGVMITNALHEALKAGWFDLSPFELIPGARMNVEAKRPRRFTFTVLDSNLHKAIKLFRLAYGSHAWTAFLCFVIHHAYCGDLSSHPVIMGNKTIRSVLTIDEPALNGHLLNRVSADDDKSDLKDILGDFLGHD